ncbi:MAG: group 1 glycosyl transferase, partial [Proteobacteria bacterium]
MEIGGTERQVVELANGLAARGHDLALWSVKGAGQLSGDLASRVHFEPLGKRSRFDLVSAPRNLLRAARSIRPDVIYSFLTSQNVSLGILKGLLPRCKIV